MLPHPLSNVSRLLYCRLLHVALMDTSAKPSADVYLFKSISSINLMQHRGSQLSSSTSVLHRSDKAIVKLSVYQKNNIFTNLQNTHSAVLHLKSYWQLYKRPVFNHLVQDSKRLSPLTACTWTDRTHIHRFRSVTVQTTAQG